MGPATEVSPGPCPSDPLGRGAARLPLPLNFFASERRRVRIKAAPAALAVRVGARLRVDRPIGVEDRLRLSCPGIIHARAGYLIYDSATESARATASISTVLRRSTSLYTHFNSRRTSPGQRD